MTATAAAATTASRARRRGRGATPGGYHRACDDAATEYPRTMIEPRLRGARRAESPQPPVAHRGAGGRLGEARSSSAPRPARRSRTPSWDGASGPRPGRSPASASVAATGSASSLQRPRLRLAVLRDLVLGAVACPINTGLKGEEIAYVVDHAEARSSSSTAACCPRWTPIRAAPASPSSFVVVVSTSHPRRGAAPAAIRAGAAVGIVELGPLVARPSRASRRRPARSASTIPPRSSTRRGRRGSPRASS